MLWDSWLSIHDSQEVYKGTRRHSQKGTACCDTDQNCVTSTRLDRNMSCNVRGTSTLLRSGVNNFRRLHNMAQQVWPHNSKDSGWTESVVYMMLRSDWCMNTKHPLELESYETHNVKREPISFLDVVQIGTQSGLRNDAYDKNSTWKTMKLEAESCWRRRSLNKSTGRPIGDGNAVNIMGAWSLYHTASEQDTKLRNINTEDRLMLLRELVFEYQQQDAFRHSEWVTQTVWRCESPWWENTPLREAPCNCHAARRSWEAGETSLLAALRWGREMIRSCTKPINAILWSQETAGRDPRRCRIMAGSYQTRH
jgi:hypothetical protein